MLKRQFGLIPPKFRRFARELRGHRFRLLDVGCGNHSVRQAKLWFPECEYYGVDQGVYNNDEEDFAMMESFFQLDLEHDELDAIPDEFFDVIVMNHVIEHLWQGDRVLPRVVRKLRPGGRLYVEFPAERSLSFPRMRGTLNFCDDLTHVRVYDIKEVANILLENGLRITRAGVRRDWRRMLLFPALLVRGVLRGAPAGAFWDIMGFAEFVYAYRPDEGRRALDGAVNSGKANRQKPSS